MDLLRFAHLFSTTWTRTLLGVQQLHPVRAQWVRRWERLVAANLPVSTICSSALSGHPLGPESQKTEQRQPHPEFSVEEEAGEDGFGTLSNKYSSRRMFRKSTAQLYNLRLKELGGEEEEREPEPRVWQGPRNTPYWYFFRCKQLIREGKLAEALDLFERQMLKEERIQPLECNYTVLIGGCGRAGYLKKAFRLYNDMKKRDLEPSDATYTALFNVCAESPWKTSALQSALKLRQQLRTRNFQLNLKTYHALLKAAAVCAGLPLCLEVFKEVVQKGHAVTEETFSFLLVGCIQDKERGFLQALQVWRQMLQLGLKPSRYGYNLLLEAARDCSLGDCTVASKLLLRPQEEPGLLQLPAGVRAVPGLVTTRHVEALERQLLLEPSKVPGRLLGLQDQDAKVPEVGAQAVSQCSVALEPLTPAPGINLLRPEAVPSTVVAFGAVSTPADRLALMGGLEGFLGQMAEHGLKPDIKTLTLLAEVVAPGSAAESSLLGLLDTHALEADVTFFNTLVRKRSRSGDLEGAKALLPILVKRGLAPDMRTFCSLAVGCRRPADGLQLLADMKKSQMRPNTHVYSALIGAAVRRLDYAYLIALLKDMKHSRVPANEVLIRQLEFAAQYPPTFNRYQEKNTYLEKIDGFRAYYKQWLEAMPAEETPHPWQKFRTKTKEA